ncbi:MAG: hypothetical protein R3Y09_10750 [Clostridia bacterium]
MTLEQVFTQFADEHGLEYRFGFANDNKTKTARFFINYEDIDFETVCFFIEEENIMLITADLDKVVELDFPTFKIINAINAQTKISTLIVNEDTKKVFAKASQTLVGTPEQMKETMVNTIYVTTMMAHASLELLS